MTAVDRAVVDEIADRYAETFGLDPEDVAVDYTKGTVEVPVSKLATLLDGASS